MLRIPKYKYLFALADLLIAFSIFLLTAYYVRLDRTLSLFEFIGRHQDLLILFFFPSLVFVFIFHYNDLYRINVILSRSAHLTEVIKSFLYGSINILIIAFIYNPFNIIDPVDFFIIYPFVSLLTFYLLRVELFRRMLLKYNEQFKSNVIIFGDGESGRLLATKLLFENPEGINLVGFIDDSEEINTESISGLKVLGNLSDVQRITKKHNVSEIIIAIDNIQYERLLEILDVCNKSNVNVKLTSELFEIVTKKISTEKYANIPVIGVSPRYNSNTTLAIKRVFDFTLASLILLIHLPFLLIIALLVKLSSPGPVFFKQTRVGRNGKQFDFYKFRSMTVADEDDEERKKKMMEFMKDDESNSGTKIINDNRVTWIGKFIRKTSLDEFPQLFNVIKGDMSLVGPRPSLPYEYENYDTWQKRRVDVLPGCTGVWQVMGRSNVTFKESVVLDLYYISNMSPWLDLQLILKTVPVMLFSKGGA